MNNLNEKEPLLEEFITAINEVLPKETVIEFAGRVMHFKTPGWTRYPTTNKYMAALYQTLVIGKNGAAEQGKQLFNDVQTCWGDLVIKGREQEMQSDSVFGTITNYYRIGGDLDAIIEKDGQGAKITMKNGCMYEGFCAITENRKCSKSPPLKKVLKRFHDEPHLLFLERPEGTHSCVIRIKPYIEALDILKEYQTRGKSVTIL